MKKETLIKVIDEEFGDGNELSWLIDIVHRAIIKNDSRVQEATKEYNERVSYTDTVLTGLITYLKTSEKEELTNGVRITHKRVKKGKSNED